MNKRTFTLGDIHGGVKALKQVLDLVNFDKENDTLIALGDYCDGWSEVKEVIDELLTIKNLIPLVGNHDAWTIEFYTGKMGIPSYLTMNDVKNDKVFFKFSDYSDFQCWYTQGGRATLNSFGVEIDPKYLNFLQNCKKYHLEGDKIFVHAGFDYTIEDIETQSMYSLIWDRDLIKSSYNSLKGFGSDHLLEKSPLTSDFYKKIKEIYVGHTPTIGFDKSFTVPQVFCKILAMDTGACYSGKLSLMDINSKEVFQSDVVMSLYPDEKGRNQISWNELKNNL